MKKYVFLCTVLFLFACNESQQNIRELSVKNTLDFDRAFETVEIDISDMQLKDKRIQVTHADTKKIQISQLVDVDSDGTPDILLFQPEISANAEVVFNLELVSQESIEKDSLDPRCYSRFVPERTDDYAWENNRVAFRTYGPVAQQMFEDGVKGGTLSSGIDAWLKRVEYPIINKWYEKYTSGSGTYHEDTGEGLDNFHVGVSRGVGGTAIKNDSLYSISKNFTGWKTITTGPIRTSFVLTYPERNVDGKTVSEEKRISLDYGSNLSRFEIVTKGIDTLSVGLTLHEKDGEIGVNEESGWVSYWEPHGDSELGTGIVIPDNAMAGHEDYVTDRKDESNLFAQLKLNSNKSVYYAGFGWKKSNQFNDKVAWDNYLERFSKCLKNPLLTTVN